MNASLALVGRWDQRLEIPLESALAATVELTGINGADACRKGLILMAVSARAITPTAKKRRKVVKNPAFVHLLTRKQYRELGKWSNIRERYFKYVAVNDRPGKLEYRVFSNNRNAIAKVRNAGLARRSWFWGLSSLGKNAGNPLPGAYELLEVIGARACGFILKNKLSYIKAIMPSGWEATVQSKAVNQVMAQVAKKVERVFGVVVPRIAASKARKANRGLASAWRAGK